MSGRSPENLRAPVAFAVNRRARQNRAKDAASGNLKDMSSDKIIPFSELFAWRKREERTRSIVATNGCFDILHVGHIECLEAAREHGILVVGINSDESVRKLKGPSRPLNCQADRARIVAALACVDIVCIFHDERATGFLQRARPHFYVKGGDYTLDSMDQSERKVVEATGGSIIFVPCVPDRSTSLLLNRLTT